LSKLIGQIDRQAVGQMVKDLRCQRCIGILQPALAGGKAAGVVEHLVTGRQVGLQTGGHHMDFVDADGGCLRLAAIGVGGRLAVGVQLDGILLSLKAGGDAEGIAEGAGCFQGDAGAIAEHHLLTADIGRDRDALGKAAGPAEGRTNIVDGDGGT